MKKTFFKYFLCRSVAGNKKSLTETNIFLLPCDLAQLQQHLTLRCSQ